MKDEHSQLTGGVLYEQIISLENLRCSWKEFKKGKTKKTDVKKFAENIENNLLSLHQQLYLKTYTHSSYFSFYIQDPKLRYIHKATVKDRVLHHAVFRVLYPIFDKTFIFDSYSCRIGKGTHRAIYRFRDFARKVSRNNSRTCWILKCDIRKFFDSIDQGILTGLLRRKIHDADTLWLLNRIISSFSVVENKGIPMGNITSQLFANMYLNEFDQFVKHQIKAKHYIRYCDDFVIFSRNRHYLELLVSQLHKFLTDTSALSLHPNKITIKTLVSGVDFLGWVNFYNHRVLRTVTKRRMLRKVKKNPSKRALDSFLGMLSHGNTVKLRNRLLES